MICIPIMARNSAEAVKLMKKAQSVAEVLEIRLDTMASFDQQEIVKAADKPVLVTYRSKAEGGLGSADDETVLEFLLEAVQAGAGFVDLEYRMPNAIQRDLLAAKGSTNIVLSNHILNHTPSQADLYDLLEKMVSKGPDIVKIVTMAREIEDNLRVLNLIPRGRGLGARVAAFSMGPKGRIGRVLAHLLGSALSFASLESSQASASGQIPVSQFKALLEIFDS